MKVLSVLGQIGDHMFVYIIDWITITRVTLRGQFLFTKTDSAHMYEQNRSKSYKNFQLVLLFYNNQALI